MIPILRKEGCIIKKYILVHDLGTTGNKASLYDEKCGLVSSSYYPYKTYYPHPGWAEQNPLDWWKAVRITTPRVLSEGKVSPQQIACVTFSGHMFGCIPVDRAGNLVRELAPLYFDQRSQKQAQQLRERIGQEKGYQITGNPFGAEYPAAKIMWIKENEPEVFRNTSKFLPTKDYIILRLTGKYVTEYSDASGMNLLDIRQRIWSEEILQASNIPRQMLPELHSSTDIAGKLEKEPAREIGLVAGIPVVLGGADVCCAGAGAGVIREDTFYLSMGAAFWIGLASKNPLYDPKQRILNLCHLPPQTLMVICNTYSGGLCYQWVKENLCQTETRAAEQAGVDPYQIMDLKASRVKPGSQNLIFLPYMRGDVVPYSNPRARGVFIGLSLAHRKEHLIRAALEGISLNLKTNLEILEAQGANIREIRVIGGGAKSKLWRKLIADVFNKRILRPSVLQEATSLGAAVAGAIGVGIFKDFDSAEKLVKIMEVEEPCEKTHQKYQRMFSVFKKAYDQLVPIFDELTLL